MLLYINTGYSFDKTCYSQASFFSNLQKGCIKILKQQKVVFLFQEKKNLFQECFS